MIDLTSRTYENILQEMLDNIPDYYDKKDGSLMMTAVAPAALTASRAYSIMDHIQRQGYISTATGEWLDLRLSEHGFTRLEDTKATVYILATNLGSRNDEYMDAVYTIPETSGGLTYTPLEIKNTSVDEFGELFDRIKPWLLEEEAEGLPETALKEDYVFILAECETAGRVGNQNSINLLNNVIIADCSVCYLVGVYKDNLGRNRETDDEFRNRFYAKIGSQHVSGSLEEIYYYVLEKTGVMGGYIFPPWRSNQRYNGTVTFFPFNGYDFSAHTPSEHTLQAYGYATDFMRADYPLPQGTRILFRRFGQFIPRFAVRIENNNTGLSLADLKTRIIKIIKDYIDACNGFMLNNQRSYRCPFSFKFSAAALDSYMANKIPGLDSSVEIRDFGCTNMGKKFLLFHDSVDTLNRHKSSNPEFFPAPITLDAIQELDDYRNWIFNNSASAQLERVDASPKVFRNQWENSIVDQYPVKISTCFSLKRIRPTMMEIFDVEKLRRRSFFYTVERSDFWYNRREYEIIQGDLKRVNEGTAFNRVGAAAVISKSFSSTTNTFIPSYDEVALVQSQTSCVIISSHAADKTIFI